MEFRILGPLHAAAGPVEATLAPRERILLALLLLHTNQPVTVARISEAIWGDRQPRRAAGQVHGTVYRLRKQLATAGIQETVILTDPAGYRAQIDPMTLDLAQFRQLRDRARTATDAGQPEQAAAQYRAGLDLWRGPALAGIDSDLLRQAAAALDEEHLQARQECLEAELTLGRAGELVAELTDLVGQHPHREGLHRLLMVALYRAGRQADALAAYRHARQLLLDELGIEPGPELQRLHQAILNRDPELNTGHSRPDPAPAATAPSPIPRELPADVAGFTGRADALKELDGMLATVSQEPSAPVVISAIAGTAGVGKTALAIHWAHRVADQFPDGQLYLNLRGYASAAPLRPIEALAGLLRSLGTPPEQIPTDEAQAAAMYRTKLAERRTLIVLDNARAVDQVRPLLPGSPACLVLVTSRDRLAGLIAREGAHRIELDVLTTDEAHALLARLLGSEWVYTEPDAIAGLARACANLPLALRIAAANLSNSPHRTIAEYLNEMGGDDRVATLRVEGDEEAAVRIALDRSYQGAADDTQRTFRLLGLVPGPDFTPAAAAALTGAPPEAAADQLRLLAGAHLIGEHAPGRYGFHDLLRLYARQLTEVEDPADERSSALERLLSYYVHATSAAASRLYPEQLQLPLPSPKPGLPAETFDRPTDASTWLGLERPNLVAAVVHAAEYGPRPVSWLLADRLRRYFYQHLYTVDWHVVTRAAERAAHREGDLRAQSAVYLSLAGLYFRTVRHARAIDHYSKAQELAQRAGWASGQAMAFGSLGLVHRSLGQLALAAEYYGRSLELHRQTGRSAGQASNHGNLGVIYFETGRLRQAADQLTRALHTYRRLDAAAGEAISLNNLGAVFHLLGEFHRAREYATAALAMYRDIGDQGGEVRALGLLAEVHSDAGQLDEAMQHSRASVSLAARIDDPVSSALTENGLGVVLRQRGQIQQALDHHSQALRLAREGSYRIAEVSALLGLAAARQRLGSHEQANRLAQQCIDIAREVGYRVLEGRAMTCFAESLLSLGTYQEASRCARAALGNHRETGHRMGEARTLALLGQLADDIGQPDTARRHRQDAIALYDDIGAPAPVDLPRTGTTAPGPAGPG